MFKSARRARSPAGIAHSRSHWPRERPRELLLVTGFFAVLLCVCFPEVSSGLRTFTPNGLFAGQSGEPRVDYPYRPATGAAIGDAGATVWLLEPWAQTVHNAYADGSVPLWDPYQALGAPLA